MNTTISEGCVYWYESVWRLETSEVWSVKENFG